MTSGAQDNRRAEFQVTDTALPVNNQIYYVCYPHGNVLRAIDNTLLTSSGSQKTDQVIAADSTAGHDDGVGYWTPTLKDTKNRNNSGAKNSIP
jgi:hypothetical protein